MYDEWKIAANDLNLFSQKMLNECEWTICWKVQRNQCRRSSSSFFFIYLHVSFDDFNGIQSLSIGNVRLNKKLERGQSIHICVCCVCVFEMLITIFNGVFTDIQLIFVNIMTRRHVNNITLVKTITHIFY